MKERETWRAVELLAEVLYGYARTFIVRWDRFLVQGLDGRYEPVEEQLTTAHLFRHLTAAHLRMQPLTLGTYALDADSQAKWLCFKAYTSTSWAALRQLAATLAHQQLASYLEASTHGGQLWLFTPVLSGTNAYTFGRQLLAQHDVAEYEYPRRRAITLYPKLDTRPNAPGSFVSVPLGLHQPTNRIYPFIKPAGEPLAATLRAQIALLAQPQRVPLDYIQQVLARPVDLPSPPPRPTPAFQKRRPRRGESLSETLKHTISVLEFVSRYVVLDDHYRGICPFHNGSEKAFQVNTAHNYWQCHAGCGGGSIIDFWMKWRVKHDLDASFSATIRHLRELLL